MVRIRSRKVHWGRTFPQKYDRRYDIIRQAHLFFKGGCSLSNEFIKPRYDAGGFANVPHQVSEVLSSGQYEAVILFVIDGFGWRFFDKFQGAPFLQQTTRDGSVAKLTSQFPSTTAAHLTTLHTGQPVGQHGIFEWIYYEPELEALI